MNDIKYRLAKPSDAIQIAEVHYHVRDEYGEGFFAHVNKDFLKQYYKVILNDPYQIVVCAELDNKILDTYKMPDGRERMSVVMDLNEHKFKLP